jgi:prephenate dehydratase
MAVNVAYPGRDGAHSAAACDRLFPDGADLVPLPSFTAVVEAASDGSVAFGVLPIESSLTGPVAETHDLLYDSPLSITAETILPIRHCLVGVAELPLSEIRVVRSHPAALDQCRRLLAAMPWATAIAAATTADAAHQVAEHGDPHEVAIASERAAQAYDLVVIAGDVGDHPEAYTRFVLVHHRPQAGSVAPGDRALRPPLARHGAARLTPDPADAVALSLRRCPRGSSPGCCRRGDPRRGRRPHA